MSILQKAQISCFLCIGTQSWLSVFRRRRTLVDDIVVSRFGAFLQPFTLVRRSTRATRNIFTTRKFCSCSLNQLQDLSVSLNLEEVVATASFHSPQQVLDALQVDVQRGLTEEQVRQRQAIFGRNQVLQKASVSWWQRIMEQFQDRLVLLLLAAAFISLVLAWNEQSDNGTWNVFIEPVVILTILVINAVIGVVQQTNAERAVEALKAYETDEVIVIRDAEKFPMDAKELVPGDIVELNTGMKVAADMRIVEILSSVLLVDQSILTGESISASKVSEPIQQVSNQRLVIQDKANILFQGTTITQGRCIAVVVGIGSATEFGKIQSDLSDMSQQSLQTPLQQKLDEFGKLLTNLVLVICGIVWIIHIDKFSEHGGIIEGALYYFKVAVALAVAAVPEGLPAVVTTCLALGAQRMAKENAIVKNLPCVETLGCTSVICCDKTGTLTTNRMRAQQIFLVDWQRDENLQWMEIQMVETSNVENSVETTFFNKQTSDTIQPSSVPSLIQLGCISSLCNDATVSFRDGKSYPLGDPTELALLYLAEKIGVEPFSSESFINNFCANPTDIQSANLPARSYWTSHYRKRRTFEFSRSRKSMSVLVEKQIENNGKQLSLLVKGAPENILDRCGYIQSSQGKVIPLDISKKQTILEYLQITLSTSSLSLRCIGFAYKSETDLIFIGIVGIADPPREQVKDAISLCKSAGIRVIMVTGDNPITAQGVARQIGLLPSEEMSSSSKKLNVLTSHDFDHLQTNCSSESIYSAIRDLVILARVEPLQKLKLVEYLQKGHQIVAMTGDGVNDAPALQKADIGIAMGSGTWVAKAAAKIVLVDDDFSTIVAAVKEGRSIYMNLKHVIRYVISSNIGEVCCILLASVLGMPETLIPVQLLWVNLITDGLPATALSFNASDSTLMEQPPRSPQAPFVDGPLLFRFLTVGGYIGVASIGGFVYCYEQMTNLWKSDNEGKTMALSVLVISEMFNALNGLSESQSIFQLTPLSNPLLLAAISISVTLHLMIVHIPWLQHVFSVTPLSVTEWLVVVGLSIPVCEEGGMWSESLLIHHSL
ncbi:Sarcoplasmic/endoplasmic reticulum calcium ATPase 1 [Galdieria sulphuraria]|nr:Sarcoplasmic/endoplasmic reticulum calcium ATPase 1 [Galdieria sulphuraria]